MLETPLPADSWSGTTHKLTQTDTKRYLTFADATGWCHWRRTYWPLDQVAIAQKSELGGVVVEHLSTAITSVLLKTYESLFQTMCLNPKFDSGHNFGLGRYWGIGKFLHLSNRNVWWYQFTCKGVSLSFQKIILRNSSYGSWKIARAK